MPLKRPLRGIVGVMGTWGVAFAVAGLAGILPLSALGMLPSFRPGWFVDGSFLRFAIDSAVRWALGGAAMGLVFSTAVLSRERKHTLSTLSSGRFALWGFLGGAAIPMGMAGVYEILGRSSPRINLHGGLIFGGICGVLGAALAVASLRAARHARAPLAARDVDSGRQTA